MTDLGSVGWSTVYDEVVVEDPLDVGGVRSVEQQNLLVPARQETSQPSLAFFKPRRGHVVLYVLDTLNGVLRIQVVSGRRTVKVDHLVEVAGSHILVNSIGLVNIVTVVRVERKDPAIFPRQEEICHV